MKGLLGCVGAVALANLVSGAVGLATGFSTRNIMPYKREVLQDIVTWDNETVFVNGERVFLYSAEIHPYRNVVPDLHLDIFQKIKALGFNCVSFYIDWALLEGKPGEYREEGVFDLKPFYDAAKEAGIYLLARPGPYINAEVSGGGFPGWLQRTKGFLRTATPDFLKATDNYMANVGKSIAAAQITNGGPIILVQPENEYTQALGNIQPFPDPNYMTYIYDQIRAAGIVVPLISNDAFAKGNNAPGQPAPVDIYGHDGYPLGFDCANPTTWPDGKLPTNWRQLHLQQSPTTPYSIVEFQGGSFDPWGGPGFEKCAILVGAEFERVFYKNLYSFGVTVLNIYMTWGGTNWGNLGHPGGYTSYDYAAAIREDRRVDREKYSELKLQANFMKVSPAYLTAQRGSASTTAFTTSSALTVTDATKDSTKFYFVRHSAYNSLASTSYKLKLAQSFFGSNVTVPQIGNTSLTLNGRDSKVHVSNYDLGGATLAYSTAEIFTWHKYEDRTVLVVYGGPGETHELAFAVTGLKMLEGEKLVQTQASRGYSVINFKADGTRKVAKIGVSAPFIYVYMVDRNEAYNYWAVDQAAHDNSHPIILKGSYLTRTAKLSGSSLALTGDLNGTTTLEIIGGAPGLKDLTFNGKSFPVTTSAEGVATAKVEYSKPSISIPKLADLKWKSLDALPELSPTYDDSAWTKADLKASANDLRPLNTPVSLYSSDYGFHTGSLLYRGTFTATGTEKTLTLMVQGGSAFGASAFLDATFLGSFTGFDAALNGTIKATLPTLTKGKTYTITVAIDHMGNDENWTIGTDSMKNPRGILDYALDAHPQSDVSWKLTGNLGGEDYRDLSRGPLNEGAFYPERAGFHLPGALSASSVPWNESTGPLVAGTGGKPGVAFFGAEFALDLPADFDVPLSFVFANSTAGGGAGSAAPAYRVQLYVNGWQYGKYVNNVGPQTVFPVPEGVLDYRGTNYVAITLWGLDSGGAKLSGFELRAEAEVWRGYKEVGVVEGETFKVREGVY